MSLRLARTTMPRVLLIHQNAVEASERAKTLRAGGYDVTVIVPQGLKFLRDVRRAIPDAIVIDIERLPSVGRDIGIALRMAKSTRNLPMVFAGGVRGENRRHQDVFARRLVRFLAEDRNRTETRDDGSTHYRSSRAAIDLRAVLRHAAAEKARHQAELVDRTRRCARRILQIAWPIARRREAALRAQPRSQSDDMVRPLEQGAESTNQENRSKLERRINLGRLAKENFHDGDRLVADLSAQRWPRQRIGRFQSVRNRCNLVGIAIQAPKSAATLNLLTVGRNLFRRF